MCDDVNELQAAIEAVRGVSSLPIVATLTFDEGAETLAGVSAGGAAARVLPLTLAALVTQNRDAPRGPPEPRRRAGPPCCPPWSLWAPTAALRSPRCRTSASQASAAGGS